MAEGKSIRSLTENLYLGFTIEELEERLEMQGGPMGNDGCGGFGICVCSYCGCAGWTCIGWVIP